MISYDIIWYHMTSYDIIWHEWKLEFLRFVRNISQRSIFCKLEKTGFTEAQRTDPKGNFAASLNYIIWYIIWYIMYDIWNVTCAMWYMLCCAWCLTYDMWYVICDTWYLIRDIWHVIHDVWYVIYDMWYVMHDMRYMIYDIWYVICYIWYFIYICMYIYIYYACMHVCRCICTYVYIYIYTLYICMDLYGSSMVLSLRWPLFRMFIIPFAVSRTEHLSAASFNSDRSYVSPSPAGCGDGALFPMSYPPSVGEWCWMPHIHP